MVYKSLFILGRLPAIGRAELESLLGPAHLEVVSDRVVASDLPSAAVQFARLGGSVRLARPWLELPTATWPAIQRRLIQEVSTRLTALAEGKLKIGLSVFDLPVKPPALLRTGLELKKACRQHGRSARLVPNTTSELSSAQVLHNQLTGELGLELLFIQRGTNVLVAQTVAVQDITAYARRDQVRPKRDARVGMLPPKLAQTIINLAAGRLAPSPEIAVLDPFCGTGVILQEALLMGYGAYGTDIEPRLVDFSRRNLQWLSTQHQAGSPDPLVEVGDATVHRWGHPCSFIASETYLGRPLSTWPPAETLHDIVRTCNTILEKFLHNLAGQIPAGTRLCLAVPAWQAPNGRLHHLPLLDHLEEMGYNRVSFEHVRSEDLVYSRPGQLVARELLVLVRK